MSSNGQSKRVKLVHTVLLAEAVATAHSGTDLLYLLKMCVLGALPCGVAGTADESQSNSLEFL